MLEEASIPTTLNMYENWTHTDGILEKPFAGIYNIYIYIYFRI